MVAKRDYKRLYMLDCRINASNVGKLGICQNAPHVNSMEKYKEKGATDVVDEWTTVRKELVFLQRM